MNKHDMNMAIAKVLMATAAVQPLVVDNPYGYEMSVRAPHKGATKLRKQKKAARMAKRKSRKKK